MSEDNSRVPPSERFLRKHTLPEEIDAASHEIIGAAIEVHRVLGPGYLEKIHEAALADELELRNVGFSRQVPMIVPYKDLRITGQQADLMVEPGIVVELKAVDRILPIHEAQVLSYLKSTGCRLGLLINFEVELLKNGLKRIVN